MAHIVETLETSESYWMTWEHNFIKLN